MDEVLHHCLRELAFDGDLGSDVTRLRDFIAGYYTQQNASHVQNLDDAFGAYMWSLLVKQPTILIGVVPEGITSEVRIAPQVSAKRKATARGDNQSEATPPPKLEDISERKDTSLIVLHKKYGKRLRIAANHDTIFAAITGSHIRSKKLSPMVYSALQIITRGRDSGVSVIDLGKRSGYDQKTCFYLVRQLTELGLVIKVRRGGVGTHFVIHKYFYERSCSWKAIREEEQQAESHCKAEIYGVEDSGGANSIQLDFTPIDARHLSSYPLISRRVVRLLQSAKNQIHASKDMLITLGFSNPTKTDRRFFKTRINEMVQKGVIERVIVPSKQKKTSSSSVKCFRLLETNGNEAQNDEPSSTEDVVFATELDLEDVVRSNTTIHKQVINLVEKSGIKGMTLNDLSASLQNFDKRTIELLLARSEKSPPPRHLLDLWIVGIMENSGRERHRRYYTIRNYRQCVNEEALDNDNASYSEVDITDAGGFSIIDPSAFYETAGDTVRYIASFKSKHDALEKKKGTRIYKNPILPDGTIKKGRPRKNPEVNGAAVKHGVKRKRTEEEEEEEEEKVKVKDSKKVRITGTSLDLPNPVKRGRPPKRKSEVVETPVPIRRSRRLAGSPLQLPTGIVEQAATGRPASLGALDYVDSINEKGPTSIVADGSEHTEINAPRPISDANSLRQHPEHQVICEASKDNVELTAQPVLQVQLTKPTTGTPNRVNISHLRRENEFMRLLENAGGVMAVHSKEFYEGHMNLLQELLLAGEPVSAPVGTKVDKRTMQSTFSSLERKGRIKQLKTSAVTLGIRRSVSLVHLPETDEDLVHQYLCKLGSSQPQIPQLDSFVKIDEEVDYGIGPSVPRGIPLLQFQRVEKSVDNENETWNKSLDKAQQLLSHDDSTIREFFLAEKATVTQLYGYVVGKALRCRQLHLSVLEAFDKCTPSSGIVSYEKRIVDLSFFTHYLPVDLYCSLMAPTSYDEGLLAVLADDIGRKTIVCNLPTNLQDVLQVGRNRARNGFLDIVEILREINLVTPLQESQSYTGTIGPANDQRFTAFDSGQSMEGIASATATAYWFHESAPIHLYVVAELEPPLWKKVAVSTYLDGIAYWKDLQSACTDLEAVVNVEVDKDGFKIQSTKVMKSFCRSGAWRSEYHLSWYQTQYLKQFVEASGVVPLDNLNADEREAKLSNICWVIGAPREVIEKFYEHNKEKRARVMEKLARKTKRSEEVKISLAKKSENSRLQREQVWSELLSRCHPNELPASAVLRIERIHKQFLQAGSIRNTGRWENDVQDAIRETDLASSKVVKGSSQPHPRPVPSAPIIQSSTSQGILSIENLIRMQGPPLDQNDQNRKRRRKNSDLDEVDKKITRRHRFQWNPEFDELARDASVIIRARCRSVSRLDWGAFEQVFPAVPRNTVRQRLVHIKETPGNEAYLRRLEDVWYELWLKHRGTEMLLDDNPQSPSNFDLIKHIQFLRSHIDKQSLRVGMPQITEKQIVVIPSTIEQIHEDYTVIEREKTAPDWDYIWNTVIEEGREKRLKRQPFLRTPEQFLSSDLDSDETAIAECAVKIVMGTPFERYDSEFASLLLKSCGDDVVKTATKKLLGQGVLSKLQRDPKKLGPGRLLKISDSNQNALGGSIGQETFQDAILLLEDMEPNDLDWHDWPLLATDGDCAALVQLVSENKIDFKIDTTVPQVARPTLDWNSKKADDDHIETMIRVQYHLDDTEDIPSRMEVDDSRLLTPDGHGLDEEGAIACCRRRSKLGLVDCSACLDEAWTMLCNTLDSNSCDTAREFLTAVRQSKELGTKKSDIFNSSTSLSFDLLKHLLGTEIPQVYWVGYKSLVLISAQYVSKWSVPVSEKPLVYLFPRRWLDIKGQRVVDFWQAAVRAVVSTIIFRPGICQSEIRWRLRTVYDRQEIIDILQYLSSEGHIAVRYDNRDHFGRTFFSPYDEQEESQVYWFIGEKHWYQA